MDKNQPAKDWRLYFEDEIDRIIQESAEKLKVPVFNLQTSFGEYRPGSDTVPFINEISKVSQLDKEAFEAAFNEKYRKRLLVIEQYWKSIMEDKLIPLKGEIHS
jgi:type I restriction enzyme R subunit